LNLPTLAICHCIKSSLIEFTCSTACCCRTGDEGAALLAQKLSGNGLLLSLDLGTNGIGDAGAAAIAEGLKLNTTLQKLDLR
jgi:hypothetical protein